MTAPLDLQDVHERLGMTPDELREAGFVVVPAGLAVTDPDMLDRMVVASLNLIDQIGERATWFRWVPADLHRASYQICLANSVMDLNDIKGRKV